MGIIYESGCTTSDQGLIWLEGSWYVGFGQLNWGVKFQRNRNSGILNG
ncbi:hypothetical protein [Borrelia sp. P9F1]|nr:hypothetical protein [Borrelia sp. P9F1]WKC58687.1 hypothetical protein QYZ68_05645 [Borrelia sp. P9F1]